MAQFTDLQIIELFMQWLDPELARKKVARQKNPDAFPEVENKRWPLSQGELATILAETTNQESGNNYSRMIKPILTEAIGRGLIKLVKASPKDYNWGGGLRSRKSAIRGYSEELEDLTTEFRLAFDKIGVSTQVAVVDAERDSPVETDELHSYLGDVCAEEIISRKILEHEIVRIAWGSGRGAYYTQEALLEKFDKIDFSKSSEIDVISLAGSLFNGRLGQDQSFLDADDIASLAARVFGGSAVTIHKVNCHLANEPDKVEEFLERSYEKLLFGKNGVENGLRPSLAIFGVGVLNRDHRLRKALEVQSSNILDPVAQQLQDLFDISDEIEDELGYLPLGDVCNRILVVAPPAGSKEEIYEKKYAEKILRMAKAANARLTAVKKRHIQYTAYGNNFVVAGGVQKAMAIFSLLTGKFMIDERNFSVPVKLLVTDRETLVEIVRIAKNFHY